jgi:hypothetical protein
VTVKDEEEERCEESVWLWNCGAHNKFGKLRRTDHSVYLFLV